MARYAKSAQKSVGRARGRMKDKKLKSGSGAKVKNAKQAIVIGLSEARSKGGKVPAKKGIGKKAFSKKTAKRASTVRKAATKKSPVPEKAAMRH